MRVKVSQKVSGVKIVLLEEVGVDKLAAMCRITRNIKGYELEEANETKNKWWRKNVQIYV